MFCVSGMETHHKNNKLRLVVYYYIVILKTTVLGESPQKSSIISIKTRLAHIKDYPE